MAKSKKPAPIHLCPKGHMLRSKKADCVKCEKDEKMERYRAELLERKQWLEGTAPARKVPDVLSILEVNSGRVRRYSIPDHLKPKKRRARR